MMDRIWLVSLGSPHEGTYESFACGTHESAIRKAKELMDKEVVHGKYEWRSADKDEWENKVLGEYIVIEQLPVLW
jgi:hypothetical protein